MKKLEELNLKEAEVLDRSAFMSYSYNSGTGTSGSSGSSGTSGSSSSSGTDVNWPGCPDYECYKDSDCKKDEMCLFKKCGWGVWVQLQNVQKWNLMKKIVEEKSQEILVPFLTQMLFRMVLCMAIVPIG